MVSLDKEIEIWSREFCRLIGFLQTPYEFLRDLRAILDQNETIEVDVEFPTEGQIIWLVEIQNGADGSRWKLGQNSPQYLSRYSFIVTSYYYLIAQYSAHVLLAFTVIEFDTYCDMLSFSASLECAKSPSMPCC